MHYRPTPCLDAHIISFPCRIMRSPNDNLTGVEPERRGGSTYSEDSGWVNLPLLRNDCRFRFFGQAADDTGNAARSRMRSRDPTRAIPLKQVAGTFAGTKDCRRPGDACAASEPSKESHTARPVRGMVEERSFALPPHPMPGCPHHLIPVSNHAITQRQSHWR